MKKLLFHVFCAFFLFASCGFDRNASAPGDTVITKNPANSTGGKMKISIGSRTFVATLSDNATASAFKKLLPMTVEMIELNGNEKYAELSQSLPTNASNPGTIQPGDLMLYGPSTLVIFYKTFSTSYNYTRLGRIDDASGFAEAIGAGNVRVTYEID